MQSNHCCHKTPTILVNQIYKKFDFVIRNIARMLFLTTIPLCKQKIACYRKKEGNNLCEYHSSQFWNTCSSKSCCQTLHKMIFAFYYVCVEVFSCAQIHTKMHNIVTHLSSYYLSGETSKMLGGCKRRPEDMLKAHLDGNSASEKNMHLVFPLCIYF